jgi:hypothetical protein
MVSQPAPAQALPPQAPQAPVQTQARGVRLPGWAMSLLFAATFIILGLTALLVFRQPAKEASASASAPLEAPPAATIAVQPLKEFKNVELTGLRLTEDDKQKAMVQCVVVNHSGADLGDISARVDLKAVTSKEQEPVGTFSFKVSLGPYESKDLKAPLTTKLRVYELPDWQFLRAEITGK